MNREQVYAAIDSERSYQDTVIGNKYDLVAHPVAAEILLMEEYLDRARQDWVDNKGDRASLDCIRKVAGIAVRCMEHHGVELRDLSPVQTGSL